MNVPVKSLRKQLHRLSLATNRASANQIMADIISIVCNVDKSVANYSYVEVYLKAIQDGGILSSFKTNIGGRNPKAVLCAFYGVWSAVSLLLQSQTLQFEDILRFVNFSHDLLDWLDGGRTGE